MNFLRRIQIWIDIYKLRLNRRPVFPGDLQDALLKDKFFDFHARDFFKIPEIKSDN
jgi:hypothetical protein